MNGMGQDQVRAIAPEVGGGFGAKINIYAEEYVASAISKRLGIPVKWIEDRSEAFVATTHGRDQVADHTLLDDPLGKRRGHHPAPPGAVPAGSISRKATAAPVGSSIQPRTRR